MKKLMMIAFLFVMSVSIVQGNSRETVQLDECVDGDTTRFIRNDSKIKVRYLAINAPEYTKEKEPYGKQASDYVCTALNSAKTIELEYDENSDPEDKYGRVLAWVYVDGTLLQHALVEEGLAEVKYLYGDYAYTNELQQAQKQAQKKQLNMWSDRAPENESKSSLWLGIGGGILLILAGIFLAKGKGNQRKLIKQGIKNVKNARR